MALYRPADARGHVVLDWLDSHHSFSFGDYYDPAHMGFGPLRVINEDWIRPGAGFPTHPHRDMEIVTYILEGALRHADSLGNGTVIRPGEVQRMSAGTGVRHSEVNASATDPVHLLQIWILPETTGLPPSYEQRTVPAAERQGQLRLLASRNGREGSVTLHQDTDLYGTLLSPGDTARLVLRPGRIAWVQVAGGDVTANGQRLTAGDGLGLRDEAALSLNGETASEVLVFDMAAE